MKKSIIIKSIISLVFIILSAILFINIKLLNILSIKYLSLIIIMLLVLNLISIICLFIKKKWLKIFTVLIYIIILLTSTIGIYYTSTTNNFLNESFATYKEETRTYRVYVRSTSKIKKIEDLNEKDISYYTFYNESSKIEEELNKVVKDPDLRPHDDLYDAFINLLCDHLTAIVIDDGYLDVLSEDYKNLDTRLRELYSFTITSKVLVTEDSEYQSVSHENIKKGDNLNIFISGSDSRSTKIYNKSRSDVNMILSINKKTHTVLLTSIPRDYYVQIHGQTGLKDKLTHAGIYGVDTSVSTVEDLFDIDIDYSIKVGFSSVVELVDLIGGIDIDSDLEFDSYHMPGWRVLKGIQHMDGKHALAYARERYAYAGGDRHRILNQQQVLTATLEKMISDKSLLFKYDSLLDSLNKLYLTDIPRDEITSLVKQQLNKPSKWKFINQTVDGTSSMEHTYTAKNSNRYVLIPDEQTVETARNKIKETLEAK